MTSATPRPGPLPAPPAGPPPESCTLRVNGLELHHLEWGREGAPVLVMLHGVRLHAHCWSDFSRRFQHRFHILALDARGHGESQWSTERDYHLHSYYEDLEAVLRERGLKQVTLLGHSLGARTAMLYTHLHQELVERLILVDMGAGLPSAIARKDFSRVTETPPPRDFATHAEAGDYLAAILKRAPREMIDESVVHGMRRNEQGRWVWKYDPALGAPPQPRPGAREWDLWEAVAKTTCPTLLLHGEESQVVTPEIAARMGEVMADCRVELVANAGHALFTEQPRGFAESVGRFLETTTLDPTGEATPTE